MTNHDLLARITIELATTPGDDLIGALVSDMGSVTALRVLMGEEPVPDSLPELNMIVRGLAGRVDVARAARLYELVESGQYQVLTPDSDRWPSQLNLLGHSAPLLLWTAGDTALLAADKMVTIDGGRASTPYGENVSAEMASSLAYRGVVVMATGSYGIARAAHRAAMSWGGRTIAVIPGGLGGTVPHREEAFLASVRDTGLVVSITAPGEQKTRTRVLAALRVMAALSARVVVVECGSRSGALMTAQLVAGRGGDVCAVPGNVTVAAAQGSNALIQEGTARLVQNVQDVLDQDALDSGN